MIKKLLKVFLVIVFPFTINAQNENDDKLMLSGVVSDYFSEDAMAGVSIKLTTNGQYANNVVSDGKGKYEIFLDFEKEYVVLYEKAGFVSKKIIVNTKEVPPDNRTKLADLYVEMTLFKSEKDLEVGFLDNPIGKAQYMSQKNTIDWNMGYTAPIAQKLNAVLTAYQQQKKAKEEAEKLMKKQYAEAMKEGDNAFFKKDMENAKIFYQKATSLDPTQVDPKNRLELIDTAIKKQVEAERLKKEEAERAAAEAKAKAEAEAAAKKQEEERIAKEKAEAEQKAAALAEAKAKAEQEAAAKKQEEERIAKEKAEAEQKAAALAEAKAKAEQEAAAKKQEEERIAKEKAALEAKLKAEAEAKAKTEQEAAAKKQEEERVAKEKAAIEAKLKAEAEAKSKAEQEAAAKKQEEERLAKEKAEAAQKAAALAEAKSKAEQEAAAKKQEEERLAKEKAANDAKINEAERLANQQKVEELNQKMLTEQARLTEEENKRNAEAAAKAEADAKAKAEAEQLEKQNESGFKVKSTSTIDTGKKGKLSKAAKQFGGGNKIKF